MNTQGMLYRLEKSAMQAGLAKQNVWVLKLLPQEKIYFQYQPAYWNASTSTIKQKELEFPSRQSAIDYCKAHNITHKEIPSYTKTIRAKSYTETICQS
jgi:hypothetical protein